MTEYDPHGEALIRVAQLSQELADARRERDRALAAYECLADYLRLRESDWKRRWGALTTPPIRYAHSVAVLKLAGDILAGRFGVPKQVGQT